MERWRNAGALPAVRQRGRGKAQGALWLHPPEAAKALRLFLETRRPRESLAAIVVRMWLRGADIPLPKLRRALPQALHVGRTMRLRVNSTGPVAFAEDLADRAMRSPRTREKYGGSYGVMQQALEVVGNAFARNGSAPSDEALANLVQCFGYSARESAVFDYVGADMTQEMRTALPAIGDADIALMTASDEDILEAREMYGIVHELVERMKRLPDNPVRDLILRLDEWHDDCFGFACMMQSVRLARSQGVQDPVSSARSVLDTIRRLDDAGTQSRCEDGGS
jgi:hypothetical protein